MELLVFIGISLAVGFIAGCLWATRPRAEEDSHGW